MSGVDNTNDNDKDSVSRDHAYGGLKYRLSYDKYERTNAKRKRTPISKTAVIVAVLAFVVFALLGVLILGYYNKSVSEAGDGEEEVRAIAGFQSYRNSDN